ncbi:MAG TPA: bifunctional DNA-formamidopyrimidine glycosylase/DNA-(apurinic or apyrimidinic site) lyase [Phycisphaerae bacterium]|nr:bifunctional DNA-formamidopyrimidine glycosylase/DNA-(apurinic or apyrimidinic site) lyase [Phycisphaerae bacterium]HRW54808.1 bifunctional DNA-formamidopyrimidine glycosylase/DNA-(apurinic or apyrimidinic site) lyase [Phycisphaerae bacterium]
MPELPEVESIARTLRERIAGRRIASVRVARPDFVRQGAGAIRKSLTGDRVAAVQRVGKRLWIELESGAACLVHLGMSGRLTIEPADAPTLPHTHLSLRLEGEAGDVRLRDPRRFGGVWFFPEGRVAGDNQLERLGPDALDISTRAFVQLCHGRRPIKSLLLDQRSIAGIGNIYADEALFDARIHPTTLADDLAIDDQRRLAVSVRRVLRKAVNYGGSTLRDYVRADGTSGEFQKLHRVYGRDGQPCWRCRADIQRIVVAQRSTHFCPTCQPMG